LLGFAVVLGGVATVGAAPRITTISPRGLQSGGVTRLTITGAGLSADTTLLAPFAVKQQTLVGAAKPNQIQVDVELDPMTPPGIYLLRVAGGGVSNPILAAVDQLPEVAYAESVGALPTAMHGALAGGQILKTAFAGKKGQAIVVDIEGQRLGGALRPVLRVFDADQQEIAWSPPQQVLRGDARCAAVLPADGSYTIELRDRFYAAPGNSFFRLKIGELKYADVVMPTGVQTGSTVKLAPALSNQPAEPTIPFTAAKDRPPLQQRATTGQQAFTTPAPWVTVSDLPEALESGDQPQSVGAAPLAISGQLAVARENDQFLVDVKPGQKLRATLYADRLGSPLDGVLSIRGEKGNQLARNDDTAASQDPQLNYNVPKGVTKLIFHVSDLIRRGGSEYVYRLEIEDLGQPDVTLSVAADTIAPPRGGATVLPLTVVRQAYNGPITLSLEDLSGAAVPGFAVTGQIPAGATIGLITVSATEEAAPSLVRLVGRTDAGQLRAVKAPTTALTSAVPSGDTELGLAPAPASPLAIQTVDAPETIHLGATRPMKLALTRPDKGDVRIRLITNQVDVKKTVKKDKKDVQVSDPAKNIAIEKAVIIAAGASEGEVQMIGPVARAEGEAQIAFVAELLSPDKKTVLQTAYTTPQTVRLVRPLAITLTGKPAVEAKAGKGDTGELKGTIKRQAGFTGEVTLTLTGLPKGYDSPTVTVQGDQTEFTLPVRFAPAAKPADLKGVAVQATGKSSAGAGKLLSNPLAVTIKVVKGNP